MSDIICIRSELEHSPDATITLRLDAERGRVLIAVGILLLVRLAYLAVFPLDLAPDEAYYWEWSRHLDWSYYSKPPMIAWIIAAATSIFGVSEFSIRISAAILSNLGLLGVYELGRRLYGHQVGVWSMAASAATPGMTALSLLMTIDAPFLFTWTASLYCLWRLFEDETPNLRWLVPSILATGAGLLSKQTSLGLIALTFLFLLTGSDDRRKMRSVAVWLWSLGSLACMSPVVWWNWRHQWITVAHTKSHFQAASATLTERVIWFFEFWAGEFGIISPLLCGLLLLVTICRMAAFRSLDRRERFLICFGAIPTTGVSLLALNQRVLPNWPVALHLTGIVLCAAWGNDAISLFNRFDRLRSWFKPSVYLGAALSVGLVIMPFAIPLASLQGSNFDLTMRLRGWKLLGRHVSEKLQEFPDVRRVFLVAATPRGPVSELAFYLPGRPEVYRWTDEPEIDSQYEVWEKPDFSSRDDALIVTPLTVPVPQSLARIFGPIEDRGSVVVPIGVKRDHQFRIWRGTKFRGWPKGIRQPDPLAEHPHPLGIQRN